MDVLFKNINSAYCADFTQATAVKTKVGDFLDKAYWHFQAKYVFEENRIMNIMRKQA